jgi:hypothetical protein
LAELMSETNCTIAQARTARFEAEMLWKSTLNTFTVLVVIYLGLFSEEIRYCDQQ